MPQNLRVLIFEYFPKRQFYVKIRSKLVLPMQEKLWRKQIEEKTVTKCGPVEIKWNCYQTEEAAQMHDCCWPYSKDGHHVSKRGACNKVSFSYNFIPTQCLNLWAPARSLLHWSIVLGDCLKADKMVEPTLHLTTSQWLVQSYLSNIFCQCTMGPL